MVRRRAQDARREQARVLSAARAVTRPEGRNVGYGSKTEATAHHGDVRFTPETGLGSRVYEYTA
jgi:hypothetical protein